jgi:hypothetical protein
MKEQTDPRFEPILAKSGDAIDPIKLGRIEQAYRCGEPLTPEEEDARNAVLEHPMGALWLSRSAIRYAEHLAEQVRIHGGEIITETYRSGRRVSRRVQRFAAPSAAPATRARGAGRPRAQATRSSARSGDSGSDGEPPGRTCACGCRADISHRAPQAKYLNKTHGDADRQRRKRQRSRVGNPDVSGRDPYLRLDTATFERLRRRVEAGCRCNGHHISDPEDGLCCKCGHRRGSAAPFVGFIAAQSAETRRQRKAVV